MDSYIKWMDSQTQGVKILLALPVIDITWGLYRLFKAIKVNNTGSILVAILTLFFCWVFGIIDIILLATRGHVFDPTSDIVSETVVDEEKDVDVDATNKE